MYTRIKAIKPILTMNLFVIYRSRLLFMLRNNESIKISGSPREEESTRTRTLKEAIKRTRFEKTGLYPTSITQISTMSHIWPETHTVTTIYRVEVDTDKMKPDEQHRDYRWIRRMEDGLHPLSS